jgi:uridine phosphorylase
MEDYSITQPTIYLERRARSLGLSLDDFHVPPINIICLKLEGQPLIASLDAIPLNGLPMHHIGHLNDIPVGVTPMNGFGAPYFAVLVEQLIACGAEIIIFSGAMGAFQTELNIGDFVIPTHAIIGEGTSHYYPSHQIGPKPHPEIVALLDTACKNVHVTPHHGTIWSTDAAYREMRSQVEHLQQQGVLGVDMETSALFTMAQHHQIKAGCIHRISDSLATFQWKPRFDSKQYLNASRELTPKILMESIKLLSS